MFIDYDVVWFCELCVIFFLLKVCSERMHCLRMVQDGSGNVGDVMFYQPSAPTQGSIPISRSRQSEGPMCWPALKLHLAKIWVTPEILDFWIQKPLGSLGSLGSLGFGEQRCFSKAPDGTMMNP